MTKFPYRQYWRYARRALLVGWLLLVVPQPTWSLPASLAFPTRDAISLTTGAPGFDGFVHRLQTRTERSLGRAGSLFWDVGKLWVWVLLSVAFCLLISAIASVVDLRMLALRREGIAAISHYLGHGTRMFFRLIRDRRTPNLARSVLLLGLMYWLVPVDLIPDESVMPGFADDLVIAVAAGKAFMYLCPDDLVQVHADAVEAEAQA